MRAWLSRMLYVLLTGYILCFYSEWSFWSGRPAQPYFWLEALPTWLLYSCLAYFFIVAVVYFRVKSIWALFLVGALYGWLGEGVYVQTMYDDFPINLSWTGLAWHSLISVLFGFYYLPKQLRAGRALIPCLLAGIVLGLWSIGWWQEVELGIAPFENVFLYNGFFGLLLIPAYALWLRFDIADFQPNRIGFGLMLGLACAYYVFVTIPTQPLALFILPICLALLFFGLWKNRQVQTPLEKSAAVPPLMSLWPLLLIPIVSGLVYTVALTIGLSLPTLPIVLVITTPAGFIMFGVALWKLIALKTKQALL